jgi:GNAT superfamily N-acetyltransferase
VSNQRGGRRGSGADSDVARVRCAELADADEAIRLAAVMYEAMGMNASGDAWRRAAVDQLRRRLGGDVMVLVVDDPAVPGRLAAIGAASVGTRLPGPGNLAAKVGYIQWMSTDSSWRRRGLARSITAALVDWVTQQGAGWVELHATPQAEPLYRALGFAAGPNPGLRIRFQPTLPGQPSS